MDEIWVLMIINDKGQMVGFYGYQLVSDFENEE